MSALSSHLENKIANYVLGGESFTPPENLHFALFTMNPSENGGGTEVTGGSYARQQVANNTTQFPTTTNGTKTNASTIEFPVATSDWGTISGFGIFDAPSGGNLLFFGPIASTRQILTGDLARFLPSDFSITFD